MVFNGHDHNYERTVPIGGVTYIVTGGGGKRLYKAGRNVWTAFSKRSTMRCSYASTASVSL
jgi:hypothetical protein